MFTLGLVAHCIVVYLLGKEVCLFVLFVKLKSLSIVGKSSMSRGVLKWFCDGKTYNARFIKH